jgi:hypothetical protein
MNKLLLFSFCIIGLQMESKAQTWATATLDINGVSAMAVSNGDLFWDYSTAGYEVPKGNSTFTIFAGAFWIGGFDTGNVLHLAGQTYRQGGNDFYPGPVMSSSSYSAANDLLWNRVWKLNKTTIDSFRLGLFSGIPAEIASWPGNGDVAQGQASQLAPYVDVNADAVYDPLAGDYPCIKGDQALFLIFNDDRNVHGETGGQKLKFEVHAMLYAFKSPGSWLDSAVFLNYKVYNRGGVNYTQGYVGSWIDFDIGYFGDDYVGCDAGRDLFYGYNGDVNDGSSPVASLGTYGSNPPAQGVIVLRGPLADPGDGIDNDHDGILDEAGETCLMSKFHYYENSFGLTGNPSVAMDYYNYLSGYWIDGTPMTYGGNGYGGTSACNYMFPGNTDPDNLANPWDEITVSNMPGDRRGMASSGPFTLAAGTSMCLDYAFVYGRGTNGPGSSVNLVQARADSCHSFYATTNPCACTVYPVSVKDDGPNVSLGIFPNPTEDLITINWKPISVDAKAEVIDFSGRLMMTVPITNSETIIDLSAFSQGVYLVYIRDGGATACKKVIKN